MESVSFGIYIVEGMMHINKIKKIIVSGKKNCVNWCHKMLDYIYYINYERNKLYDN